MSTQGVRELLQGTLDLLILRTLIFGSQETGIPESFRKGENYRPISRVEPLPKRHAGIILFPVELVLVPQRPSA